MTFDKQKALTQHHLLLEEAKNFAMGAYQRLIEAKRLEQEIQISAPPVPFNTIRLAGTPEESRILDFALLHYIEHVEDQIDKLYHPKAELDKSKEWETVLSTVLTLRQRLRAVGNWDRTTNVMVEK